MGLSKLNEDLVRLQILVEGYKLDAGANWRRKVNKYFDSLRKLLKDKDFSSLNSLTAKQLRQLIVDVRKHYLENFSPLLRQMLVELEAFTLAQRDASESVWVSNGNEPIDEVEEDKGSPIYPILVLTTASDLWSRVRNKIMPASGLNVDQMIASYDQATLNRIVRMVRMSAAAGESVDQLIGRIMGTTQLGSKGGIATTIMNQGTAVQNTNIQHASGLVSAAVDSLYAEYYELVAVMDSRTSQICRYYDGRRYRYGKGPLPPFHYNCRTSTLPVRSLKGRQIDILPEFSQVKIEPLALKDFVNKAKQITKG